MWTVIYITPSQKTAKRIREQLASEGFLVKIRQSRIVQQYEILVTKGELEEIREILSTVLP